MNRILLKVAMLLMFILAVLGIWTAMAMTFPADIWNFLLGVVGVLWGVGKLPCLSSASLSRVLL